MSPSGAESADTPGDELTEKLLDFLVYAPIGLVLDAQTVAPDLARRGRQHTAAARQIGEMAVKAGLRRLGDTRPAETGPDKGSATVEPTDSAARAELSKSDKPKSKQPSTKASQTSATDGDRLGIEEYDLLAASQVVKRLDSLSADELKAVGAYETATRGRRTILNKVNKLQAAQSDPPTP